MSTKSHSSMDTSSNGVDISSAAIGVHNEHTISTNNDDIHWLIVSKRDGKSRLLPRRMIFIGREECDIILQSTTVDKRHAVIFFNVNNQQFHIKDLNTSYGTYVNEKRIADQCYVRLQHSDRLRFGFGPDVFSIEKISSLPLLTSSISCEPLLTSGDLNPIIDNSNQLINKSANDLHNKSDNNIKDKEYFGNKSEGTVEYLSDERAAQKAALNRQIYDTNSSVSERLPTTARLTAALGKKCENNSNSSLSTVDSLEEIKSTKHKKNLEKNDKNICVLSKSAENEKQGLSHNLMSNKTSNGSKDTDINEMRNEINKNNNNCSTLKPTTPVSPPVAAADNSIGSALGSTPGPATAFIIAFDFDDKKKMNIKDSIRQFAPPKPDSIEKPRPPKSANNSSNESNSTPVSRRHYSPTISTKHKFNPTKSANLSETNGHLSDSATYLINRMLSCQTPANKSTQPSNMRPNSSGVSAQCHQSNEKCSPTNSGEKDSGLSDDTKSETGTYTVESEQNDQQWEEARKNIGPVFGVLDDSITLSLDSTPDSSLNSPTLLLSIEGKLSKATSNLLSSPKSETKLISNKDFIDLNQQISANNSTFTRTKRRLPTAQEMLHQIEPKDEIKSTKNDLNFVYSNVLSNNRNNNNIKSVLSRNSSQKSDDLSSVKNKTNASVYHSAPTTPRSPLVSRKITELQTKTINNRRKNSWNHSNSDLDYYESYNSDESTDHSHRSSNSAVSKDGGSTSCASVGSKMRFNRAFALRRARLGIETPGIDLDINKNRHKTTITNTNNVAKQAFSQRPGGSGFSRGDGGRYSLRLTKNEVSDNNTKNRIQNNSINRNSLNEKINKNGFQRKNSDPFNSRAVTNRFSTTKSAFSDTDRHSLNNNNNRVNWNQRIRQNPNLTNNNTTYVQSDDNRLQKSSSFANSVNGERKDLGRDRDVFKALQTASKQRLPTSTTKAQQMNTQLENGINCKNSVDRNMTASLIEPIHKPPISTTAQQKNRSVLELTALDGLVVSAINQLSQKLRTNVRSLLESQRLKHELGSDARVMIDEILPQVSSAERRVNDNAINLSRDLSNVLKNLKKVEQSLEAVTVLLDPNNSLRKQSNAFYVVDV